MNYTLLKFLHVFGVLLFLGNIIVTAVWKAMADRSRDPAVVAFGQRLVTVTDFAFTAPGAILVLFTGMMMIEPLGVGFNDVRWLRLGLDLFLTSGVIWLVALVPLQIKQARMARAFPTEGIPERYWKLGRWWMGFGLVATLLPLVNLYLMVAKPQ
jgi:uncharacterized membrane protein